jgi:hypothetical protein
MNPGGIIRRVDEVWTEEALKANDGMVVPLKDKPGGTVIGEATLRYDEGEKALKAEFNITDPKMADFLKDPPPTLFDMG